MARMPDRELSAIVQLNGTLCLVTKKLSLAEFIIYEKVLHQLRNYSNARPLSSHTITRLLVNNAHCYILSLIKKKQMKPRQNTKKKRKKAEKVTNNAKSSTVQSL